MISRTAARLIAETYVTTFCAYHGRTSNYTSSYYTVNTTGLYDFLFDNEHSAWFCNAARDTYESQGTRKLKDFIMKLHTGETVYAATVDWDWTQREKLGQRYLHDLAEDILTYWKSRASTSASKKASEVAVLQRQLEVEGYEFRDGRLLEPETEVLDVAEETGVLRDLHKELGLANQDTAFHHLGLTEEHYVAGRWDDSISNSRKFLEAVLQEVVATHSLRVLHRTVAADTYSRPARVRDYLERENLLEAREKQAVAAVYGLLSNTGSHPFMAQQEQARLLRHLALTLAQFAMLRLRGSLAAL